MLGSGFPLGLRRASGPPANVTGIAVPLFAVPFFAVRFFAVLIWAVLSWTVRLRTVLADEAGALANCYDLSEVQL